jgi:uncharacterized protein
VINIVGLSVGTRRLAHMRRSRDSSRASARDAEADHTGGVEAAGRAALRPAASLSADEARRIALRAQAFLGAPDRRAGARGVLRRLGAVQLDTISVLARSHELVAYARLGPVGRAAVEAAYWSRDRPGATFEFWAHAACVLPIEEWPWFAFRRRHHRERGWRGWGGVSELPETTVEKILGRLREEGPLTATDLGGAKRGGPWWDWSDVKVAVEWLLDTGEVVCVERRGWRRVYDLAERAVPADLLALEPPNEECHARLVRLAGEAMGVATASDLADYYRLKLDQVEPVLEASGLVPVEVEAWGGNGNGRRRRTPGLAWADPQAVKEPPRGRHRTTLLSPFDSLIWERRRTARIFGWTHAIEAYKPAAQRMHGYYAMPLLAGGKLVGRVDPKRERRTLVARQLSVKTPSAVEPMAQALREAAEWVGCDSVRVEHVTPASVASGLRNLLG